MNSYIYKDYTPYARIEQKIWFLYLFMVIPFIVEKLCIMISDAFKFMKKIKLITFLLNIVLNTDFVIVAGCLVRNPVQIGV